MFSKARKYFCGWTHLHSKLLYSLVPPCEICIHVDTGEFVKFLNNHGLIFEDFNILVHHSLRRGDMGFHTQKISSSHWYWEGTGEKYKELLNISGCHNIFLGSSYWSEKVRHDLGSQVPYVHEHMNQAGDPNFSRGLSVDGHSPLADAIVSTYY